jgi:hypothetical protein
MSCSNPDERDNRSSGLELKKHFGKSLMEGREIFFAFAANQSDRA